MKGKLSIMLCLIGLGASSLVNAGPNSEGRKGAPPPEAIEVCEGKAEGDSVTFTTRRGHELTAKCEQKDEILVAVPEGHPHRGKKHNRDHDDTDS